MVDTNFVTMATVLCALIAAFAWNITTWWVGLPSSFEPRADWRALWRCTRDCAWKLVGIEMEQRALAEGGYSDDYIAAGWLFPRRSGYVRAFSHLSSLQPVHGFAAETSALSLTASVYGIPLSTTHVISTSLMGVGAAKRFSEVKWTVVERIIWTWILTLPATGLIGFILARTVAAL